MTTCRYSFVLLDLDGTLVDTGADLVASTNHVRESFGLEPLGAGTVEHLVGDGARALVARALGPDRQPLHDEGLRRFLAHYADHCLDHSAPYPGIVEAIDELRALDVRLAVLTNKSEALARKVLEGLGLLRRFVGLVGGDTFPGRKPDPCGLEHLRAAGGVAPGRCLMVGDSEIDVRTARAGSVAVCGVLWGFAPERVIAAAPDHLVADAASLVRVIREGV